MRLLSRTKNYWIALTGLGCLFFLLSISAAGQKNPVFDSSYYKTYPKQVTGRFFFSKKYTGFTMDAPKGERPLRYRPNTSFSTGVGATYGALTLNLGFGLGFLNPNKDEKGKTSSIDLQSHIYTRKWVIDLYGQFYKGYYLSPRGLASTETDNYYLRRDIRVNLLGASVYRLLNSKQFSYRAALLQNEWQKKSAGSFLVGGEIYTGVIKADSTLVPGMLAASYAQRDIIKTSFTEFGPGIGYAYTGVYKEHFFATGSISLNGDIGFVKEYTATGSDNKTTISPNITLRAVAGYNSDNWSATVSWVNNNINLKGNYPDGQYLIRTGNFRITLAKRFKPGKRLKERLKIIDQLPNPG
jgi:Domain of unknown function (DUF4421)